MASERKEYVGVRLDAELLARVDALAVGQSGLTVPRSEVIRLALARGLDALEAERRPTAPSRPTARRARG